MTTKITGSVLANTAVTIGTYGGTTQIPVVTVDQQGRVTFAANATPSIANTQITGTITGAQLSVGAANTNLGFIPYNSTNPAGYTTNLGTVTSVSGTAPVVSSGGTTPAISMPAATASANGFMTSTYASKLDGIAAGAQPGTVTSVTGTSPVVSSGGTTPAISMAAATAAVNGYMTSTYAAKLDGIAAGATNVTNTNQLTNGAGYITGITSGNVTTALGYTPYNSTNPNGYTTNTGTVTAVATGNGLQGGTITSTGTLSVACPTFNTVGSYGFLIQEAYTGNITPGSTKAGNLTFGGIWDTGSGFIASSDTAASGTWRCMGYSSTGTGTVWITLWCRVS